MVFVILNLIRFVIKALFGRKNSDETVAYDSLLGQNKLEMESICEQCGNDIKWDNFLKLPDEKYSHIICFKCFACKTQLQDS